MKIILKPQPKRILFDHNKKENFTVTLTPKYKDIYVDGDRLIIDGKRYRIVERGCNYSYFYKVLKSQIRVIDIDRFTKFLQTDVWDAESPYPFEYLFDNIVNKVTPIK